MTPDDIRAMTDHPILFNSEMIRAYQAGLKTMTRRVIVPQPEQYHDSSLLWRGKIPKGLDACPPVFAQFGELNHIGRAVCPYYRQPGDRLWVRETWGVAPSFDAGFDAVRKGREIPGLVLRCPASEWADWVLYRADGGLFDKDQRWRPSIHMPRWASRITLEVVSVRVERLQDISRDDCIAEGIDMMAAGLLLAVARYRSLWDSINAKRGHGWETNPWVWVIEFKDAS